MQPLNPYNVPESSEVDELPPARAAAFPPARSSAQWQHPSSSTATVAGSTPGRQGEAAASNREDVETLRRALRDARLKLARAKVTACDLEADLKLVLAVTQEGLLKLGPGGHVLFASRKTTEIWGLGQEEIVGKSIKELLPRYFAQSSGFRKVLLGLLGASAQTEVEQQDGTFIPVEIHLSGGKGSSTVMRVLTKPNPTDLGKKQSASPTHQTKRSSIPGDGNPGGTATTTRLTAVVVGSETQKPESLPHFEAFEQGSRLLQSGRRVEALRAFEYALERRPDSRNYKVYVIWCGYLIHKQSHQTIEELQSILSTGENENAALFLGHILRAQGDEKRAAWYYRRAYRMNPDNEEAIRSLRLLKLHADKKTSIFGRLTTKRQTQPTRERAAVR